MMFGIGLLKGMRVTLRRCFSKPNTVQYPEERLPLGPTFRGGTIDLNLEKLHRMRPMRHGLPQPGHRAGDREK